MEAFNNDNNLTVLLPMPFMKGFTYSVPKYLKLQPGEFVIVPLGTREVTGVVWDTKPDEVPPEKLKLIKDKLDVRPLPEVSRRFIEWVSNYLSLIHI